MRCVVKKSFCLFLALLVLGSVCAISAHFKINEKRDQVELTEGAIYGDPAAAEGLELRVTCDHRLFWDTTRTFGENARNVTDFRFTAAGENETYENDSEGMYAYLSDNFGISFGPDGEELEEIYDMEFDAYRDIISDVAGRTLAGGENTETLRLRDYIEYYPIYFDMYYMGDDNIYFRLDDGSEISIYGAFSLFNDDGTVNEMQQWLREFFRVPVSEEHSVQVTVSKNSEGRIVELNVQDGDYSAVYVNTFSFLTENACLFSMSVKDANGQRLPVGNAGEGSVIYGFPFEYSDGKRYADIYAIKELYRLPEGESLFDMKLSEDGEDVLLITMHEDDGIKLHVLDAATMQEKQSLSLAEEALTLSGLYYYEDFFAVVTGDSRLMLVEKAKDGEYQISINALMDSDDALGQISWRYSDMAWNGEKLAVATSRYEEYEFEEGGQTYVRMEETCGCWVSVYDNTGLIYSAAIYSSLSSGMQWQENYYSMPLQFVYNDPIELSWT